MLKYSAFAILIASLSAGTVMAFESLEDEQLSESTGQTGITISTSLNWTSTEVQIHDLTGVPATIKPGYEFNTGDLVLTGWGIQGCTNGAGATCTTTLNPTFNIELDSSGGATPVARAAVAWDSGIQKIRLLLDKVSIRNGSGGNAVEIMDLVPAGGNENIANNGGYIDIIRPGAGTPTLAIELGNEVTTGHMLTFSNADFGTISFGKVLLRDKSDTLVNNRNLRFGLDVNNLNLTGATVDVTDNELLMTTPNLTNLNVIFSNVTAGATAANMGGFGAVGVNMSNLNIRISGKS